MEKNEDIVRKYEEFQKKHTTPEQHQDFLNSLSTTPKFVGHVQFLREAFLGSDEDFERALEHEISFMVADLKRLRKYMKAKGY